MNISEHILLLDLICFLFNCEPVNYRNLKIECQRSKQNKNLRLKAINKINWMQNKEDIEDKPRQYLKEKAAEHHKN